MKGKEEIIKANDTQEKASKEEVCNFLGISYHQLFGSDWLISQERVILDKDSSLTLLTYYHSESPEFINSDKEG